MKKYSAPILKVADFKSEGHLLTLSNPDSIHQQPGCGEATRRRKRSLNNNIWSTDKE